MEGSWYGLRFDLPSNFTSNAGITFLLPQLKMNKSFFSFGLLEVRNSSYVTIYAFKCFFGGYRKGWTTSQIQTLLSTIFFPPSMQSASVERPVFCRPNRSRSCSNRNRTSSWIRPIKKDIKPARNASTWVLSRDNPTLRFFPPVICDEPLAVLLLVAHHHLSQ